MATISTRQSQLIDRSDLAALVGAFYTDVRKDELLGPIFSQVVGDQWDHHLERMTEFWSTVMLGSKSFKGNVYRKHVLLRENHDVRPEHFLRWINLWIKHTSARFDDATAEELQRTATGIGRNLFYGFFGVFAKFIIVDGVVTSFQAEP